MWFSRFTNTILPITAPVVLLLTVKTALGPIEVVAFTCNRSPSPKHLASRIVTASAPRMVAMVVVVVVVVVIIVVVTVPALVVEVVAPVVDVVVAIAVVDVVVLMVAVVDVVVLMGDVVVVVVVESNVSFGSLEEPLSLSGAS